MPASNDLPVLLWGAQGCGKGGFLGALYNLYNAGDPEGTWSVAPVDVGNKVTKDYLIDMSNGLLDQNTQSTLPQEQYPAISVIARKLVGRRAIASLPLAFRDPAGELTERAERARTRGAALLDEMVTAGGVIWLVDVAAQGRPDFADLTSQLGSLRQRNGGRPLDTPVAFCLSKIDLLPEAQRAELIADPERAFERIVGEHNFNALAGTFRKRSYYAMSSKGFIANSVRPEGLDRVLDWIHGEYLGRTRRAWVQSAIKPAGAVFAGVVLLALMLFGADRLRNSASAQARARDLEGAIARLEQASRMHRGGDADSVLTLLREPRVPAGHERALDWDTLVAFAARDVGMRESFDEAQGDSLLEQAHAHATNAIDNRTLTEPASIARLRFHRARLCQRIDCDDREVLGDLEYAAENAADGQTRRAAARLLREVKQ